MTYGSVVQTAVEVESVRYYSLEDLVPIPCTRFLQRGFVVDINNALTKAVTGMAAFADSTFNFNITSQRYYCYYYT